MGRKITIEEMQEIAKKKKGKCLSTEYVNAHYKLKWECQRGHIWNSPPTSIKSGRWCPDCGGRKKLTIEEMQEIAMKRKGKCLSKKYINNFTELKWKCKKGHTWNARPTNIKTGRWCPDCVNENKKLDDYQKKIKLKELQKIAKERKGKCLSTEYINIHTKLRWECVRGHQWEAIPLNIKKGVWCPDCNTLLKEEICRVTFEQIFNDRFIKIRPEWLINFRGNRMELDGYSKSLNIAFEYNGQQHYKEIKFFSGNKINYLKNRKNDDLEKIKLCKKNHVYLFIVNYRDDIFKIPDLIRKQSKILKFNVSKFNLDKKINFNSIYYGGATFKNLKDLVKDKKGKVISEIYFGSQFKLEFQCEFGHQWKAMPRDIKQGRWCPDCGGKQKLTIEEMQEIAKKKKGKCLSKKYINNETKLKWKCKKGHIWNSTPMSIKNGSWCPDCYGRQKLTIEEMQEIAMKRKGKCLSTKYINLITKLKWQCEKGHTWKAMPRDIKYRLSWCSKCRA